MKAIQLCLFDVPIPATRRNGPYSSICAEDELQQSGKMSKARKIVYSALLKYPGCTAREISTYASIDHPTTHKRLPELEKLGFAVRKAEAFNTRKCRITGKICSIWYPSKT